MVSISKKHQSKKNLKLLDNKIKYVRRNINKLKLNISTLNLLISNQLRVSKEFNSKKKLFKNINKWVELAKIQRNEFSSKQDKVVFETLQSEGGNVKGKIIETIHHFHNTILKSETLTTDIEQSNSNSKLMKKGVKWITTNIWDWINDEFLKYEIKMNVLSISASVLNYVYISIISSIFAKKNNIIFENILSQLSDSERVDFGNTLKLILSNNPKLSFLFFESSYKSVLKYDSLIYQFDEDKWVEHDAKTLFSENRDILLEVFNGFNKLKLSNNKGRITYNGDKIELDNAFIQNKKNIILNPFLLNKSKTTKGKIEVFISGHSNLADENIHLANTKSGDKFYFYREEKFKSGDKVKIYYDENSLV